MPSLDYVPASRLAATYAAATQNLRLFAADNVVSGVTGIHFRREPWAGGLQFALEGWYPMLPPPFELAESDVGPIGTKAYHRNQQFSIPNIKLLDPSNTVIVRTANHRAGVSLKIN